ncbi:hypothetical protein [Microvirga sesbaniae]|uniref:hypothetical protein n=1 Tax=Microvirga sesbaniae TaxID=681392 RepID=UPI0021C6EEA2|nr:hypothetical protein [Microvirga sp. HBU67692]
MPAIPIGNARRSNLSGSPGKPGDDGGWRGLLVYRVSQDDRGRWMVDWRGRTPELIGRGTVVQGVVRRPQA